MMTFDPGVQPSSRRPLSKGSRCTDAGSLELPGRSTPTRATLPDCWAPSAPAALHKAMPMRASRRFIASGCFGRLLLFLDQPVDDAAHCDPRLVLPERHGRRGAEVHVLLLGLHHRHVLEED